MDSRAEFTIEILDDVSAALSNASEQIEALRALNLIILVEHEGIWRPLDRARDAVLDTLQCLRQDIEE